MLYIWQFYIASKNLLEYKYACYKKIAWELTSNTYINIAETLYSVN